MKKKKDIKEDEAKKKKKKDKGRWPHVKKRKKENSLSSEFSESLS